jgi:putative ABC transport system substrate-binding protein
MRRARAPHLASLAVLLVLAMPLPGCSRGEGEDAAPKTIAFLRAVGGNRSSEPFLLDELDRAGFVEGRNLRVLAKDPSIAFPDPVDAGREAARWTRDGVDLIVALSTSGAAAARDAAPDTPVLFVSNDPTAGKLVTNERTPSGRLTGVTYRVPADRTLDLARRAIPGLRRVGLPYPSDDRAAIAHRDALVTAANHLGVDLVLATFTGPADAKVAVDSLADQGVQAIVASNSPLATRALEQTQSAVRARGLPLVVNTVITSGAIVALYPDAEELGRQLGRQAFRLLSGSPASAVPVENPRRFQLRVDLVAARSLGVHVPDDLVQEADVVAR